MSGGTVKHMLGLKCIHDIVVNAMEYLHIDVPVALHLDHGTSREACEAAITSGFSSIMLMARICRSGKIWPLPATW
ncbi:fructose-1,6-bisphosphate aldolase [Klebsiella pneumoniae]|uniref:Fructose-1,6-bisphosphate aldolase n=1 Tax=Klebsiella pneumoniae TaxID=573 RepID=A0A2X3C104_KLEPN|nr:fructose-1,6-bisphosphate aldolase [Klebsiella pneumoniae]